MLVKCWASVSDAVSTLNQHWFNVSRSSNSPRSMSAGGGRRSIVARQIQTIAEHALLTPGQHWTRVGCRGRFCGIALKSGLTGHLLRAAKRYWMMWTVPSGLLLQAMINGGRLVSSLIRLGTTWLHFVSRRLAARSALPGWRGGWSGSVYTPRSFRFIIITTSSCITLIYLHRKLNTVLYLQKKCTLPDFVVINPMYWPIKSLLLGIK